MSASGRTAGASSVTRRLTWPAVTVALVGLAIGISRAPLVGVLAVAAVAVIWLALDFNVNALMAGTLGLFLLADSSLIELLSRGVGTPTESLSRGLAIAKFVALGVLAVTAMVPLVDARRIGTVPSGFARAMALLAGLALLSSGYGFAPAGTFVRALSLAFLAATVAVTVPMMWREPADVSRTLKVLLWLVIGTTVAGFLVWLIGIDPFAAGRFRGILSNANTLGYFAAPTLPLWWALAEAESSALRRAAMYLGVSATGVALLLSGSRAGLLAAVSGITFGLLAARGHRRALVWVALTVVAVGSLVALTDRAAPALRSGQERILHAGTGSGRVEAWREAVSFIEERPVTGWGFGSTPIVLPALGSSDLLQAFKQGGHVHNGYLEAALELGVPGGLLLLLLMVWSASAALRAANAPGWRGHLGAAIFGAIVAGIVESAFETGLTGVGGLFALPFGVVMAAAHVLARTARSSTEPDADPTRTGHHVDAERPGGWQSSAVSGRVTWPAG